MRLLLDSHAFLWWILDDRRLSRKARAAIAEPANTVEVSAVTAWELIVKVGAGRLRLPDDAPHFIADQIRRNRFGILPLQLEHALAVARLPAIHRDPLDRLLVAQALVEASHLVSADRILRRYRVPVLW